MSAPDGPPRTGPTRPGPPDKAGRHPASPGRRAPRTTDPAEVERLRHEVVRLRNELFTAREEGALALQQARVEAGREFLESLGHELRTSLSLVLGWTELLLAGDLPPERQRQAYDIIFAAGWRIEAAIRWLERAVERSAARPEAAPDEPAAPPGPEAGGPARRPPTDVRGDVTAG